MSCPHQCAQTVLTVDACLNPTGLAPAVHLTIHVERQDLRVPLHLPAAGLPRAPRVEMMLLIKFVGHSTCCMSLLRQRVAFGILGKAA